jgi:hypothetical protein
MLENIFKTDMLQLRNTAFIAHFIFQSVEKGKASITSGG